MIWLLALPVVLAAIVVGAAFGWKYVLAPLLGLLIWRWAVATLRSFRSGAATGTSASDEPTPVTGEDERTLYWCQECGTELLLVIRGSGVSPRHCGARMHERSEILN